MTNKEKVLDYLEHHDGITTREAFHKLNITRLSAIIDIISQISALANFLENYKKALDFYYCPCYSKL